MIINKEAEDIKEKQKDGDTGLKDDAENIKTEVKENAAAGGGHPDKAGCFCKTDLDKKKRTVRFPKLSGKIILMLLLSLFLVTSMLIIIFNIARAAGFRISENREEIDAWTRYAVYVFPPGLGLGIVALFSFILNKTIVARIRKLEKATKTVAGGGFDVNLEVKGFDELSDLCRSFNLMAAQLRANEYLNKDFIKNVSHEFKTPLAAIRAYGELIESETDKKNIDRDALKSHCKIIMEESGRLAALSKSILALSLLDSAAIIKKEDNFCPAEQIRCILRLMHKGWSEKKIELDLRLNDFNIASNEQLLYQVWQNLISNAIKFSSDGGVIKIVLTKAEGGLKSDGNQGALYFEIADSGVGIRDEDKEKIFNQFFMSDASRKTEGSGLGLPIVKKIIEKLDGEITFESEENGGSRFFVCLPL